MSSTDEKDNKADEPSKTTAVALTEKMLRAKRCSRDRKAKDVSSGVTGRIISKLFSLPDETPEERRANMHHEVRAAQEEAKRKDDVQPIEHLADTLLMLFGRGRPAAEARGRAMTRAVRYGFEATKKEDEDA